MFGDKVFDSGTVVTIEVDIVNRFDSIGRKNI